MSFFFWSVACCLSRKCCFFPSPLSLFGGADHLSFSVWVVVCFLLYIHNTRLFVFDRYIKEKGGSSTTQKVEEKAAPPQMEKAAPATMRKRSGKK